MFDEEFTNLVRFTFGLRVGIEHPYVEAREWGSHAAGLNIHVTSMVIAGNHSTLGNSIMVVYVDSEYLVKPSYHFGIEGLASTIPFSEGEIVRLVNVAGSSP